MEFKEFLIKLFTQMATGNFIVKVECGDGILFDADVIGYSEEMMEIKVRFHSDDLTKPGTKRIYSTSFGYDMNDGENYRLEDIRIPVKEENIFFESIKL